jgi:dynein heavy chain, axonemal
LIQTFSNVATLLSLYSPLSSLLSSSQYHQYATHQRTVLHITLLIWKNSKYYNTPKRLCVLIRKVCNAIINRCCSFLSGKAILGKITDWENIKDAQTIVDELQQILNAAKSFKGAYEEYKQIANAECPRNPWKIQRKSLFTRLDNFLERCVDNLNIAQTVVQFSQLADIEIGGTQGKVLSVAAQAVWSDFQHLTERFLEVDYDLMDVTADGFASDFYYFRQSVKELERRTFCDSSSLYIYYIFSCLGYVP